MKDAGFATDEAYVPKIENIMLENVNEEFTDEDIKSLKEEAYNKKLTPEQKAIKTKLDAYDQYYKLFNEKKKVYETAYKESPTEEIEDAKEQMLTARLAVKNLGEDLYYAQQVEKLKNAQKVKETYPPHSQKYKDAEQIINENQDVLIKKNSKTPFAKERFFKNLYGQTQGSDFWKDLDFSGGVSAALYKIKTKYITNALEGKSKDPKNTFASLHESITNPDDKKYLLPERDEKAELEEVEKIKTDIEEKRAERLERIKANREIINQVEGKKAVEEWDKKVKAVEDAKTEADKKKAEEEKNATALENFQKGAADIMSSFGETEPIKEDGFVYNKDDYKKQLPLEALGQGALGLLGLASADNELPLRDEKVSEATMAFLAENRRLSKMGLPPELESQAKRQLQESTALGIENLKRASGGNRNAILANIGGLDANRAKGIAALNIADMQARDEAFARYGQTLQYIDNFNKERDVANHNIKLNEALTERAEGKALAGSAFSNMLNEIQYQRENGPGSANDMFMKQMQFELYGEVYGFKGKDGEAGSAEYKRKQNQKEIDFNAKLEETTKKQEIFRKNYNSMTPQQRTEWGLAGKSYDDLYKDNSKPVDFNRWSQYQTEDINFEDKLKY